jgi:drug/metabolite transporter (DMT)-like permease
MDKIKISKEAKATLYAILAATLYSINTPISKLLLKELSPTMMAALLYLGAGLGLSVVAGVHKSIGNEQKEQPLTKKDLPYTIGMIVLDIAAPIFLMIGLTSTTAANASLLNNFEIVATSIIAMCLFKEVISKRLWIGIFFVTVSSIILSVKDVSSFSFSFGSIFVLLACICWGLENNCTRMISERNPLQIVVIKGFFSGIGSMIIAVILRETTTNIGYVLVALCLGFIAYGLSILFYIYAQRDLGAAKTSTYYSIAPFIGALLSLVIFKEIPGISFIIALAIMFIGAYYAATDLKNI